MMPAIVDNAPRFPPHQKLVGALADRRQFFLARLQCLAFSLTVQVEMVLPWLPKRSISAYLLIVSQALLVSNRDHCAAIGYDVNSGHLSAMGI